MRRSAVSAVLVVALVCSSLFGQQGPFDPEEWPETIDQDKTVHFVSVDFTFTAPGASWDGTALSILTDGDQVTGPIAIGGHNGLEVTGGFLNVADTAYAEWADNDIIDILVQVYGNDALLGGDGNPRAFNFLTGVLPELNRPFGGSIPVGCKNHQWNWFLFRIDNGLRLDGTRFVGSVPAGAQGNYSHGGVNGGTIRFENVPGLVVRLVAFGEQGAFGEPDAINACAPPFECPPEPETNLVSIDIDAGTSDHFQVLNDGNQTVTFVDDVGPVGDLRRAVVPQGNYLNFGITDNYLGEPCNDPHTVKVCVEFYDDPALSGASFGPEAYATDDLGGVALVGAERRHMLTGSDRWIRRSWAVPNVCLAGVNAGTLTAGPRFISESGKVPVSKISLAVLRTGTHPLAGQDPLADCYEDPLICTDAYGSYAELDLQNNVEDGLRVGDSGGDQEMLIADGVGPADDLRRAVRPAFGDGTPGFTHNFLNFAIIGEPFGPSSQPNARLAMCITYYDDPALIGATFRPEVYQVERGGQLTFGFADPMIAVSLIGTDAWKEAYFEIPEIKFNGVNQGPQAAARFVVSAPVFVTRVRYAVIRPCGPMAGENQLEDCGSELPPEDLFKRGDTNSDGGLNIADAIFLLGHLFARGPIPTCADSGDANDDGALNIADAVKILGHLFAKTGPLNPPFDACGPDGTPEDPLDCASFPPCE